MMIKKTCGELRGRTLAVLVLAGIATTAAHGQQTYPTKPIRMIAPSSAGGPVDLITRALAQGLSEALGQQVVVENRVGAAGLIGTELVAKAPPDGYTLLLGFSGPLAIVPNLVAATPYDPLKDLVPVSEVAAAAYVLLVHPSVPARSVKELMALARAQPGKLNFGSGGNGTGIHMASELLKQIAGVKIVHVPYKGAAPAMTALMAGEVDMMFNALPPTVPYLKSDKLRPLATGGAKRSALVPYLPTLRESGYDFEMSGWYGVLAPRGTPPAIVTRLNSELIRVLGTPAMKERFTRLAVDGVGSTPEAFARRMREELARWAKVIAAAGLKSS
jgi:tripartite-type tricarboxylate transporter receptor subunit TctC